MICGNMEINKVLEEMEFFSNIFNILEERRKTVLFRTRRRRNRGPIIATVTAITVILPLQ